MVTVARQRDGVGGAADVAPGPIVRTELTECSKPAALTTTDSRRRRAMWCPASISNEPPES
jgi:hypothetical protein